MFKSIRLVGLTATALSILIALDFYAASAREVIVDFIKENME